MSEPQQAENTFVPNAATILDDRVRRLERRQRAVAVACLLLAAFWLARQVWRGSPYSRSDRLESQEFCYVKDLFTSSPWMTGPSTAYAWPLELQRDPTRRGDGSGLEPVLVEAGTIVQVERDGSERKRLLDSVNADIRPVAVQYVTGANSGRTGYIERYKLSRLGRLLED